MSVNADARINVRAALQPMARYFQRPIRLFREYDRANLRPDLIAGVTVAVVLLPQAIAFALVAELPPQAGLYTAIVAGIVAALWGSSAQMFTGPANAISLLVLSVLTGLYTPGTDEFYVAAGLMAVMVGIFQIAMGLARLGFLVNFVSHSVIVGFAAGAGVLIGVKQLSPFLGIEVPSQGLVGTLGSLAANLSALHLPTAEIGVGVIVGMLVIRRINPRLPAPLITMILASLAVFIFNLEENGVAVIGQLPQGLPPLAELPLFDLEQISRLSTGALAVGAIALVQVTAITRSISAQTGQRLDSNQEFVGQGLANLFSGFFSGYDCAGSFSITAVNFKAGARSPMASIFASLFVLLAMSLLGALTAYLPRAALAGVLIVTAYGMVDQAEITRIWQGASGDAAIMVVTLLGTVFLRIEFAVLLGIMLSFALYISRTSTPRVHAVLPDDEFQHFGYRPEKSECPQLGIMEIMGDLYFGAVTHVEEVILEHADKNPGQRFLLLRMHHVNHCDFSGIHMLENVVRAFRGRGGDVYLVHVGFQVRKLMESTGFDEMLGHDHFLEDDKAISHIFYHVLDPAICIYECPVRAFRECQNLPKRIDLIDIPVTADIPPGAVESIEPVDLWARMHDDDGRMPYVIDVRERREYDQGHIPDSVLVPLPRLLAEDVKLPNDRPIVCVCRGGRRGRRAAYALQQMGVTNVLVLEGGVLAWETAGLLEAV